MAFSVLNITLLRIFHPEGIAARIPSPASEVEKTLRPRTLARGIVPTSPGPRTQNSSHSKSQWLWIPGFVSAFSSITCEPSQTLGPTCLLCLDLPSNVLPTLIGPAVIRENYDRWVVSQYQSMVSISRTTSFPAQFTCILVYSFHFLRLQTLISDDSRLSYSHSVLILSSYYMRRSCSRKAPGLEMTIPFPQTIASNKGIWGAFFNL